MAADLVFTEREIRVDEGLGYPKAFAKLCSDRSVNPYGHGPPFTFTPYALQHHEALRASELDELFPVLDPKAKPSTRPKIFVSLLWKQLNHLGNAGFDPATFRVDPYGNVLYYHADPASPLAWDIDHWFPLSRGGLTVPSNLRILQWKVCKKKHNKLEFLIPWWELQVGISINQFLSIFASSNSDFRHRAFSMLFTEGESEELNESQTVDSHVFPQHFAESANKVGLAPAAVVVTRRESYDDHPSALKSLDTNRRPKSNFPIIAARKLKTSASKENENPEAVTNPYQAIVVARDSLKHKEETTKMQTEIQRLDDEVNELNQKTEEEKLSIQELELVLIKRRRRAEKCRRLAESQSSYRAMLEKMIRDAMHQSVVYKEQVRLNQAASNALMARLEAQKAICDSSEKDLHRRFIQREELEAQVKPEGGEQARKRSRMDDSAFEEGDDRTVLYLPSSKPKHDADFLRKSEDDEKVLALPGTSSRKPKYNDAFLCKLEDGETSTRSHSHKELRVFLEEEQKAYEAGLLFNVEQKEENNAEIVEDITKADPQECDQGISVAAEDEHKVSVKEDLNNIRFPVPREPEIEEDDESRRQRGKGNIEKWLHLLLENTPEEVAEAEPQSANAKENKKADDIIRKLNLSYPQEETKVSPLQELKDDGNQETVRAIRNPPYRKMETKISDSKESQEIVQAIRTPPYSNKMETKVSDLEESQGTVHQIDEGKGEREIVQTPPNKIVQEKSSKGNDYWGSGRKEGGRRISFDSRDRKEKTGKEKGLVRSESFRAFRLMPSSPSVLLGMKKGVDCMRKKPSVMGDEDVEQYRAASNSFLKSSINTIKKVVKM